MTQSVYLGQRNAQMVKLLKDPQEGPGVGRSAATGTPGVAVILAVIALALAVVGYLSLSPGTLGLGLIGLAVLLLVVARLIQADRHHRERQAK